MPFHHHQNTVAVSIAVLLEKYRLAHCPTCTFYAATVLRLSLPALKIHCKPVRIIAYWQCSQPNRFAMDAKHTILFYGNSLAVSSVAANLTCKDYMILRQVDASVTDLARQVQSQTPDVLIFDLAAAPPNNAIGLLREYPRLLLIGVDSSTARMIVLSGRRSQALTIDDLIDVIDAHSLLERDNYPQPDPKGDEHE